MHTIRSKPLADSAMNAMVTMPRDIPDHPVPPLSRSGAVMAPAADAAGLSRAGGTVCGASVDQGTSTERRSPPLHFVPPQLPIRAARQNIASYVHLYGAEVTRYRMPIEAVAPAALCRIIRNAVETAHEGRRERAETIVRALALSIITAECRPLGVPRTAFDLLKRLSRQSLVARHVGESPTDAGAPPDTDGGGA